MYVEDLKRGAKPAKKAGGQKTFLRWLPEIINKNEGKMKITHLKRREVQAPIVSSLINAFADKIGYNEAIEITKEVVREDAILSGKTLAEEYSGNSIAELSKIVKEVWAEDDAFEIKIIKETDKELFFDISYLQLLQ